jgi:hypothetical protein
MDENKKVYVVERKDEKNGTHWNEEDEKINLMFRHIHACCLKIPGYIPVSLS